MVNCSSWRLALASLAFLSVGGLLASPAWAQAEKKAEETKKEEKKKPEKAKKDEEKKEEKKPSLEKRVESLEKELAEYKAAGGTSVKSILGGLEMKGYVDFQYLYNFARPEGPTPGTGANGLRVFDTKADSFRMQDAQLDLSRPVANVGDTGGRLVLNFGPTANSIASAGTGAADEFDVQQAYAEYLAPVGDGLNLKFGKMATLAGAEVIEGMNNWNISRSFGFGFAIPFTHTGMRAAYKVCEPVGVILGVNNGWDNLNDNNQRPSYEGQILVTPCSFATLAINGIVGPEQADINSQNRKLLDTVLTLGPFGDFTFMMNYDRGADVISGDHQTWEAGALYAKYQMCEDMALAGRVEFFADHDGLRTGTAQHLKETTLTLEHRLPKGVIVRVEGRWDRSNQNGAFPDHFTGTTSASQRTAAFQVIVPF